MSDQGAIPLGLAQQRAAKHVDPEQLESMGKRAAALYGEGSHTLNDAVVENLKTAKLAPEQVKRVCEFANTSAYLREFEKAGEMRNITFDNGPADPSYILKELNDGSAPAVHQVKTAGYAPPTTSYKSHASDALLAEAFGVDGGLSKVASIDHAARADRGEEVADLKIRLEGVHDDIMSKYASSGVLLGDVKKDLCEATRQEIMNGASLGDVVSAWSAFSPRTSLTKEAMDLVRSHLAETDTMGVRDQEKSLVKVASGSSPNPAHPIVDRFIAFTKVATEHRKLEHALDIVKEQLQDVNAQLRSL